MSHSHTGSAAAWLAAPGLALLLVLLILPAASIFAISLTDWEFGRRDLGFVGPANFLELAGDERFRAAFTNTLLYTAVVAPATFVWGLLLALLIDGSGRLRDFYRAVHFLPMIATLAAMAIAWDAILHPTAGLLNTALGAVGLSGANWLRDEDLVLPALMAIGVWHNAGFAVIMFLAALRSIPQELLDAAQIDGIRSPIDRLRHVVLPLLAPVSIFVLIITAERAFSLFDTVRVLTRGGPAYASEALLHLLFVESFDRLRAGYGAAVTIVYLAAIGTLTLVQRQLLDKKAHYG